MFLKLIKKKVIPEKNTHFFLIFFFKCVYFFEPIFEQFFLSLKEGLI